MGTPGTWQFSASKSGYQTNSWGQSITETTTKNAFLVSTSDTTAPTVTITNPSNGTTFTTSSITVSGMAYDSGGSGLDKVIVLNYTTGGGNAATGLSGNSFVQRPGYNPCERQ